MDEYDGRQFVGIDLHRQRSVIVRQSESGEQLSAVRIVNDPVALELQLEQAGVEPEVVLEATYGWYWAVDVLQACGARVHLAHPLGVKGFRYRRVKNDVRDAADLADLLRMGRLPEAWIAPPKTRELRELVRYRAKLVATRSGLKAQIHAVLAKAGVLIAVSDLFGIAGRQRLAKVPLGPAYAERIRSLLELIDILDSHEARFAAMIADGWTPTGAIKRSSSCPASDRRWRRYSSPRSVTCTASPTPPAVLIGRADPATPRVRHRRAPRTHHQTRLQSGPLGGDRGGAAAPDDAQDLGRQTTHRGPPRQKHRQSRCGTGTLTLVYFGLRDGHIRALDRARAA